MSGYSSVYIAWVLERNTATLSHEAKSCRCKVPKAKVHRSRIFVDEFMDVVFGGQFFEASLGQRR